MTASATGAMLMNLCKRRDQFEQVIANRALIPQAIEECLRYQSSGLLPFRDSLWATAKWAV